MGDAEKTKKKKEPAAERTQMRPGVFIFPFSGFFHLLLGIFFSFFVVSSCFQLFSAVFSCFQLFSAVFYSSTFGLLMKFSRIFTPHFGESNFTADRV